MLFMTWNTSREQTCSTDGPELDCMDYLSRYIQLVLESLYIFTSLKTLFALHIVIHHCFVKSYNNNSVYDSLVSPARGLT